MDITDKMLYQNMALVREKRLESLPQRNEIPEAQVSPEFQEKMDRLLHRSRQAERRRDTLRMLGRTAAVLLLFAAVSFAGIMTVSASFREKVVQTVMYVYREYTQYQYSDGREDTTLPELRLDALPEGFAVLSDESFLQFGRSIHCENDAGKYLNLAIKVIGTVGSVTQIIDTENAQVSVTEIQGREVTIVSKNGWIILFWTEDSAVFTVDSNLELSELIPFVESITEKP